MLRKAKRLPVIIMLVLITVFLGSLFGCGDSADPLGTGVIQFYDATTGAVITSATVNPGSTLTLVVKVKNLQSDGTTWVPVIGEKVTFTLVTPANSGGLTVVNDRTIGDGQASAVYTAGNNSATDSVSATTSNGATATITITKTGGLVGARISSLAASSTSVFDGETSIITATVTDGNDNPMMGEAVTFTIATNDSGACFIDTANACVASVVVNTDAGGLAVAIYHAGGDRPTEELYDTVRATLANGSTNAVVITRSVPTPATSLSITVAASPASVSAGQVSIITATLTGDDNAGVTVSFTLPLNNSGATLSSSTAITDGAGNAQVIYQAGSNSPTLDVSDTVLAAVGTANSAAAITRTGTGATSGYSIAVAASPSTLTANDSNSTVTATVTSGTTAISDVMVIFTVTGGGTVAPGMAITDGNGNAVITFTGDGAKTTGQTDVVTASITVSGDTYTASVVITYP